MKFLKAIRDNYTSYLFLLPSLFLLTALLFIPIFLAIKQSFFGFEVGVGMTKFIGFENYMFWFAGKGLAPLLKSIVVTVIYTALSVGGLTVVALIFALITARDLPFKAIWRGLSLIGYAAPAAVGGVVWSYMLAADKYGWVHTMLNWTPFIEPTTMITQQKFVAFLAVVLVKIWRDYGFAYVILLAAVMGVPKYLYESAKVYGASSWQQFKHVTLPTIFPALTAVMFIRTVFTVGKLTIPWAITKGGPAGVTTNVAVLLFKQAFVSWEIGRAAALGMLFAALLFPLAVLWIKLQQRRL